MIFSEAIRLQLMASMVLREDSFAYRYKTPS